MTAYTALSSVADTTAQLPDRDLILLHSGALRRLVALLRGMRNGLKAMLRLFGRRKEQRQRLTILVTGASAGIGLELARLLIRGPHRLVLTARGSSLSRFVGAGIVPNASCFCPWISPARKSGEQWFVPLRSVGAAPTCW